MLRSKLQSISVSRNNSNLHPLFLTGSGNRTEQIVCLQSGFLDDRNVHRLQHLFDDRNLLTKFFCHRLSCSFIISKHLMTKCRCMNIKCDRQILRFFFFQNFKQDIQKSIHRIRMKAFCIGQIRHSIEGPV